MSVYGTPLLLALVGTIAIAAQQPPSPFDVIPRDMVGDIEISSTDDKLMTLVTIDSNGETRDGFVDYAFLIKLGPVNDAPVMRRLFGRLVRRDSSLDLEFQNGKKWTFVAPTDAAIEADTRFEAIKVYPYTVNASGSLHEELASKMFATIAMLRKQKPQERLFEDQQRSKIRG